ncbi:MAG: AarF/UbiB family protein [Crocinitomicaceae bacterium]|nr:AarF/UbiB family protein [Crocinitomicaceae bacterium]
MNLNVINSTPLGENKKRKFGSVFLLENETGEKFILKMAKIHELSDRALHQLKKECSFSFNHFGLPQVVSTDETDEAFSFLLTYKEGKNLTEFWKTIKRKNRLNVTKQLVAKIAELLDVIHQQQIYHCDIKPGNFIIQGDENNFSVHLIDFGMAVDKNNLTERKLIFPLGFAAPELILNKTQLINHTTDYFALGITIYQLWTGELPLAHPNPSVFTNLQLAHPLPEHDALPKKLYQWLNKVCAKPKWRTAPNRMTDEEVFSFLNQSFSERYKNSKEMIEDLEGIEERKWRLWG